MKRSPGLPTSFRIYLCAELAGASRLFGIFHEFALSSVRIRNLTNRSLRAGRAVGASGRLLPGTPLPARPEAARTLAGEIPFAIAQDGSLRSGQFPRDQVDDVREPGLFVELNEFASTRPVRIRLIPVKSTRYT